MADRKRTHRVCMRAIVISLWTMGTVETPHACAWCIEVADEGLQVARVLDTKQREAHRELEINGLSSYLAERHEGNSHG